MIVTTVLDLGAVIRDQRGAQGLTQRQLADRIGASREWVIRMEQGAPRTEVGLVLRVLDALSIQLDAHLQDRPSPAGGRGILQDIVASNTEDSQRPSANRCCPR